MRFLGSISESLKVVYVASASLRAVVSPLFSLRFAKEHCTPMLVVIEDDGAFTSSCTRSLLRSMEIPFSALPANEKDAKRTVGMASEQLDDGVPFALFVNSETFRSCMSDINALV